MSPVDPLLHHSSAGMGIAFVELRRFNDAILAGKKAQRQSPSYSAAYRCLTSAFALLGRDAEARKAARVWLRSIPPLQYLRLSLGRLDWANPKCC